MTIQNAFEIAKLEATRKGYKIGDVSVNTKPVPGLKVGYSYGFRKGKTVNGKITLDSRFVDWCNKHPEDQHTNDLLDVMRHELAHLIAETVNTKKKHVWHGQAWKDIHISMGGSGERFYAGKFVKPENVGKVFKSMKELRETKPTEPKESWEQGTFNQWLARGYHVIRGQHGQLKVWEFNGNAYEREDGEESTWGRASAVYFTPDQVESN